MNEGRRLCSSVAIRTDRPSSTHAIFLCVRVSVCVTARFQLPQGISQLFACCDMSMDVECFRGVPWLTAQTVRVAGLAWTQYKNCSFVSSR
jgi:hypothetical protein